ncbi:hypothetical protein O6H91_01G088300 [Diphasiastrum complanatum]|uniref:Uncharacterized protein n=1 Tax=Diphasiastrum complanatum TaxID=34168 RepID=A0ACC2ET79_DIPCM|nr:hypothetical protein O6H91_01G088300 [Diphasiastrum complanatum]
MMKDMHREFSFGGDHNIPIPQDILSRLPSDPFEQLDIARGITSMAVRSRVSNLEDEVARLRQKLAEKEHGAHGLEDRVLDLEQKLQETTARLLQALDEQAKLTNEKNVLMATIRKLNRDVAKLETFKRTLMQSLQEDDEKSQDGSDKLAAFRTSSIYTPFKELSATHDFEAEDGLKRQISPLDITPSDSANSLHNGDHPDVTGTRSAGDTNARVMTDATRHNNQAQRTPSLTPRLTPELTPTGSPKRRSTAGSPRRKSSTGSPKQYYANENRVPLPSSQSTSQATTAPNSPPAGGSLPTRTPKVDGKEFFRQARNRLSYEQFSAFLANIKELNAHRRTREETLRTADEIFGPENKDLYKSFEGLLSRHVPA